MAVGRVLSANERYKGGCYNEVAVYLKIINCLPSTEIFSRQNGNRFVFLYLSSRIGECSRSKGL